MTKGTSQFIKDYMFPKSKEDTITAISEQLAAYREIKERVEDLEKQITLLEEVQAHDRKLTLAKAEQVKTETLLRIWRLKTGGYNFCQRRRSSQIHVRKSRNSKTDKRSRDDIEWKTRRTDWGAHGTSCQ